MNLVIKDKHITKAFSGRKGSGVILMFRAFSEVLIKFKSLDHLILAPLMLAVIHFKEVQL